MRRPEQCLCDSVSDPMETVWVCGLLQAAVQEQDRLRMIFNRDFSTPDASVNGAATGATVSGTRTGHSTAQTLPNGAGVVNVTGQSTIPGPLLNLSTPTFQPVIGDLTGNATYSAHWGACL